MMFYQLTLYQILIVQSKSAYNVVSREQCHLIIWLISDAFRLARSRHLIQHSKSNTLVDMLEQESEVQHVIRGQRKGYSYRASLYTWNHLDLERYGALKCIWKSYYAISALMIDGEFRGWCYNSATGGPIAKAKLRTLCTMHKKSR